MDPRVYLYLGMAQPVNLHDGDFLQSASGPW